MVHRAIAVREPSPLRRLGYRLGGAVLMAGVASSIYVLASLCLHGTVVW